MDESRRAARAFPQLKLKLVRDGEATARNGWAHNIDMQGLLACGIQGLRQGDRVHLEINPSSQGGLHLNARVTELFADGAACAFEDNSPASLEVLSALLTPTWDGDSLLDGVLRFAPWGPTDNLANWMRLTSLVADWHRRVRRPAAAYSGQRE